MKHLKKFLAGFLALCLLFSVTISAYAGFGDVGEDNPYKDYVNFLAEKGIVNGYSQSEFAPYDICTREQLIALLHRASGSPKIDNTTSFTDIRGDEWFAGAVSWARENNITRGYADGTFGVGKPLDRMQAMVFIHKWARLEGRGNPEKSVHLVKYVDAAEIEPYAIEAMAWAAPACLLEIGEDTMIKPGNEITRGEVAYALAKIMGEHSHLWTEYTDSGDGTHWRECDRDTPHKEVSEHTWNDGELTKKATNTEKGEITYTCTACRTVRTEETEFGAEIVTRGDLEDAITSVAWAYALKGERFQYDGGRNTTPIAWDYGGSSRSSALNPPETATKDNTFYGVCAHYANLAIYESLGFKPLGKINLPYGLSTIYLVLCADNQLQTSNDMTKYNEPIDELDVDACLARYMDYERWKDNGNNSAGLYRGFGFYNMGAFTDYTTGLNLVDDGFDGEVHYSYYDEEGNILTADEVKEKYFIPYVEDYEKNLRPGDFLVDTGHTRLYVGGGKFLHCTTKGGGGKYNQTDGIEKLEKNGVTGGAIWYDDLVEGYKTNNADLITFVRPLEFVVKMGYDEDPANDIVKDLTIPEKTKSRLKYPMLDIDRTVDITHAGTAVKGGEITYSVEISNKSDNASYLEWLELSKSNLKGNYTYDNICVTETIPEGCELVLESVTSGGTYENGKITWNAEDLAPGKSTVLSYRVKVTGEIGSVIVNGGGMVDNIPSNIIRNTIGGEKLSETEKSSLLEMSSVNPEELRELGTDLDFAENIYRKIGEELTLPNVKEVIDELFTITAQIPGSSEPTGGFTPYNSTAVNMFVLQTEVSRDYKDVQKMIIDNYWCGNRFFISEDRRFDFTNKELLEFREEYLEPGDIIVYATARDRGKTTMTSEYSSIKVMVYTGDSLLCSTNTEEGVSYEIHKGEDIYLHLMKAFMKDKDLVFALRPSQV